jgi:hypothetical protein
VTGWYPTAGPPVAVWNLNLNNVGARSYLYFYLSDLAKRLGTERVERQAALLERIPAMAAKIEEARAQHWNKYPSVYLEQVLELEECASLLFAAIKDLTEHARAASVLTEHDQTP